MTNEEVLDFINSNKFGISGNHTSSRCIDGRYEDNSPLPALAKPGADAGDLMIAFAACNELGIDIDNSQILDSVLSVIGGPSNFSFHSDHHASADTPGLGCGHLKQAKLDPGSYELRLDQIEYIFSILPQLLNQDATQIILNGDHQEKMVLIINSDKYSVKPSREDGLGIKQSFIYHQTLDTERQKKLAQSLSSNINFVNLPEGKILEAVQAVTQKQLGETAKRLAGSLPVYNVSISNDGTVTILS